MPGETEKNESSEPIIIEDEITEENTQNISQENIFKEKLKVIFFGVSDVYEGIISDNSRDFNYKDRKVLRRYESFLHNFNSYINERRTSDDFKPIINILIELNKIDESAKKLLKENPINDDGIKKAEKEGKKLLEELEICTTNFGLPENFFKRIFLLAKETFFSIFKKEKKFVTKKITDDHLSIKPPEKEEVSFESLQESVSPAESTVNPEIASPVLPLASSSSVSKPVIPPPPPPPPPPSSPPTSSSASSKPPSIQIAKPPLSHLELFKKTIDPDNPLANLRKVENTAKKTFESTLDPELEKTIADRREAIKPDDEETDEDRRNQKSEEVIEEISENEELLKLVGEHAVAVDKSIEEVIKKIASEIADDMIAHEDDPFNYEEVILNKDTVIEHLKAYSVEETKDETSSGETKDEISSGHNYSPEEIKKAEEFRNKYKEIAKTIQPTSTFSGPDSVMSFSIGVLQALSRYEEKNLKPLIIEAADSIFTQRNQNQKEDEVERVTLEKIEKRNKRLIEIEQENEDKKKLSSQEISKKGEESKPVSISERLMEGKEKIISEKSEDLEKPVFSNYNGGDEESFLNDYKSYKKEKNEKQNNEELLEKLKNLAEKRLITKEEVERIKNIEDPSEQKKAAVKTLTQLQILRRVVKDEIDFDKGKLTKKDLISFDTVQKREGAIEKSKGAW
ncbi:MAG: hypothetical protein LBJ09_02825 [Clostridiales bacterium]|jgi:hypothetical protein|nr:hypothetical protein [Clostridiales bacterium]